MTDLPGSLGTEATGVDPPVASPGWFGGAIDEVVADLIDQFGRLDDLWIEVWIYVRAPADGDVGWILRDVRPAGPEPKPWRRPADPVTSQGTTRGAPR